MRTADEMRKHLNELVEYQSFFVKKELEEIENLFLERGTTSIKIGFLLRDKVKNILSELGYSIVEHERNTSIYC